MVSSERSLSRVPPALVQIANTLYSVEGTSAINSTHAVMHAIEGLHWLAKKKLPDKTTFLGNVVGWTDLAIRTIGVPQNYQIAFNIVHRELLRAEQTGVVAAKKAMNTIDDFFAYTIEGKVLTPNPLSCYTPRTFIEKYASDLQAAYATAIKQSLDSPLNHPREGSPRMW